MERSYQKKKFGFVAWMLVLVLTINAKCDAFFLPLGLSAEAVTEDDNNLNITTATSDTFSVLPSDNVEKTVDTNITDNYATFNNTDEKTLNTYQSIPTMPPNGQEEATTQIVNFVKTVVNNVVNTLNTTKSEIVADMPLVMSSSNERVSRIQHEELSFGLQISNETVNEEQVALPKTTLYSEFKTDNENNIEILELPNKNHVEAGDALEKQNLSSVKDQIILHEDRIEPIHGVINDIPQLSTRNVIAEDLDIEYSQISKAELFHKNDSDQASLNSIVNGTINTTTNMLNEHTSEKTIERNINLTSAIEKSSTVKHSAKKIIDKPKFNKYEEAAHKQFTYGNYIPKSERQMRAMDKSVLKKFDQIGTDTTQAILEKSTILPFEDDDVKMPKMNLKSDANSESEGSSSSSSQEDEIEKKEKESESVESFSELSDSSKSSESNESSSSSIVNSKSDKDPESVFDRDFNSNFNSNSNLNSSSNSNKTKSDNSSTNIHLRSTIPNEEENSSTTGIEVIKEYTTTALMETATEIATTLVASSNTTSVLLNEIIPIIGDGHHHVYKKEKPKVVNIFDQNYDLTENATDTTSVSIVEPVVKSATEIVIEEENKTESIPVTTLLELVEKTTTEFSTSTIQDQEYTTEFVIPVVHHSFPADTIVSFLQPSPNVNSDSMEDITLNTIEWQEQGPQTDKTQLVERTTEEYLAVLPTQEPVLEHDLNKKTEPLIKSTLAVAVSITTTENIDKVQEHVSITSGSPMLNPNESTLTPNAVELITSTPGVENLVSKGSRSIDESLTSRKSSRFSEDYIEETSSGVSKALPTRRIEYNTASGRSLLLIALCLTIAVLFLGFVTTIFFVSIQRHRGTLDIEMQEQHCGIDQDDEETMHTLLTPSQTDSGED